MKNIKTLVPILLVALLGLAWFSMISGTAGESTAYNNAITEAEQSIADRLYEQAIEYYKESLRHKVDEETYMLIKQTYDMLYKEEHTAFFRQCYIDDMAIAANVFPDNEVFWWTQVDLYAEEGNYNKAFHVLKDAVNRNVQSETILDMYREMLYMVKLDYKTYDDFKTALNGYISVYDGTKWTVLDDTGERITAQYQFVGLINDDGKGIFTNDIDTRLLDSTEVTRARFNIQVEEAGYYHEGVDLVPVKIDGVWKYLRSSGEFLPGEFEVAGSYYDGQAAAKTAAGWVLLDAEGNQTKLSQFEDIRLDLYGCHIQNGMILAKSGGKYHFYDLELNQIGDFSADAMDIYISDAGIAFQQNGKWGFVDPAGNVVVEPVYHSARSFANGYAAVCNAEGLWGFINDRYELVIDYAYHGAFYFTQSETCLVANENGTVQFMKFVF